MPRAVVDAAAAADEQRTTSESVSATLRMRQYGLSRVLFCPAFCLDGEFSKGGQKKKNRYTHIS